MSGKLRVPAAHAGSKAAGEGSTHVTNAKPLASGGAKASGGADSYRPDKSPVGRKDGGGSKASAGAYTGHGERVTSHHRK